MAAEEVRATRRLTKDLERMRREGLPLLDGEGKPLGWEADGVTTALTWRAPRGAASGAPKLVQFGTAVWGPADTPYAGAVFRIRLTFSANYPMASPSVGFVDPVLHCNVDERSGSICLDALNTAWSATTVVSSIADALLQGLLAAPNPDSPLNPDAAALMAALAPSEWATRVRGHARRHAWLHAAREADAALVHGGVIARPLPPAWGGGPPVAAGGAGTAK